MELLSRRGLGAAAIGVLLMTGPPATAGEEATAPSRDAVYGRTPAELVPYGDYGELHRRNLFPEPLPYHGPGREGEDPEGLERVDLGLLAPTEDSPDWPEGRSMTRGAILAVEQANEAGGYEGLPFHLIPYEDLPIWGASSNKVVEMAYEDRVWAALGSVSGDSSHIAIRVALKALLPIMNSATGDPTLTETGIPWAFRCIADARQQGYALAHEIFVRDRRQRVAVLRANTRYGRMGIAELRDAARRLNRPFVTEVNWLLTTEDFTPLIERIQASRPDALVVWGEPDLAGRALARARELGLDVPAYGPSRLISEHFLREAGRAAEGLVAVATFDPTTDDPAWLAFRQAYRERWEEEPDAWAAHAFDGMNLVLGAVREAGLNRVRIRDALAAVERYEGVTGTILFDNTFNDVGPVYLARVEDGEFRYREKAVREWDRQADREPGGYRLGLLGPAGEEPSEEEREAERGIRLALEERQGDLLVRRVSGPWSTAAQVARDLMVRDGADGILTLLDHAGSHAAAQVATKLRRPLVTINDPSPLLRATGVPWVAGPFEGAAPESFESRYRNRFGSDAGPVAGVAYLGARRLLEALEEGTARALAPVPSPLSGETSHDSEGPGPGSVHGTR